MRNAVRWWWWGRRSLQGVPGTARPTQTHQRPMSWFVFVITPLVMGGRIKMFECKSFWPRQRRLYFPRCPVFRLTYVISRFFLAAHAPLELFFFLFVNRTLSPRWSCWTDPFMGATLRWRHCLFYAKQMVRFTSSFSSSYNAHRKSQQKKKKMLRGTPLSTYPSHAVSCSHFVFQRQSTKESQTSREPN